MARLELKRACYARQAGTLVPSGAPLAVIQDAFGDFIGGHLHRSLAGIDPGGVSAHFMCSTMIDVAFASGALDWLQLQQRIGRISGFAPGTLVNAYECASWGYALRHALRPPARPVRVLLSIVDLNLLNLSYWNSNPYWGASGFGIATVLLECAPGAAEDLVVGCAKTHNAVAELGIALRNTLAQRPGLKLAKPFFPSTLTGLLERQVGNAVHLEDLHPHVGHCFGSDPWLSVAYAASRSGETGSCLAASLALNGYWAMAEVQIDPDGLFRVDGLPA
jgi:hypothetical protein